MRDDALEHSYLHSRRAMTISPRTMSHNEVCSSMLHADCVILLSLTSACGWLPRMRHP